MERKERLPVLAVTCGDPAGVGPEIAVRAAVSRDVRRQTRLVLVGPESVWKAAAQVAGVGLRLTPFERRGRRPLRRGTVEFVPTAGPGEWRWGEISAAGGETAFRAVEKAVGLVRDACCDAVVTAPLNKESLRAAGVPYIGHTEILAGLTQSEDPLTVFLTGKLCVFFFTRHLPLSEVPERLKTEPLRCFILRCRDTLREWGIAHRSVRLEPIRFLHRPQKAVMMPLFLCITTRGTLPVKPLTFIGPFLSQPDCRFCASPSITGRRSILPERGGPMRRG